jgi:mono/diheme cytochrome c family protein
MLPTLPVCFGRLAMIPATLLLAALLAAPNARTDGTKSDAPPAIDFNRQIRPILSENCFACHGPDEKARKANLRLDVKESAFGPLRSGLHAIVPGKADESELVARITADDANTRMPPPKSGKKLKPEQIALLKQWIDQGAPFATHWAYVPPKRPAIPPVRNRAWPRNAIDEFILARLERAGLQPSPEADKVTLIRRVTLDLTGLPPTLAEIDAFLADGSPEAYERLVDRLLQSPRYGEHMARFWLDAARYGDTHGLHLDNYREIWPYREWVIRAFNRNLPFDQFIIEQLAGDLLPNATLEQIVATGFNRCHVSTSEGGSIEEEVYVRNVVDQVDTNGTVFLGLAVGCARCHDHKYDPITQKDYYQLFAFFNSIDGKPLDGNAAAPPPVVRVPSEEQKQKLAALQVKVAELEQRRQARAGEIDPAFTVWLAEVEKKRQEAPPGSAASLPMQGLIAYYPLDERGGDRVTNAAGDRFHGIIKGRADWTGGKVGGALQLDGKTHVDLGDAGNFERTHAFSYGAWVKTTSGSGTPLARMDDANGHRGYDLYIANDQLSVHILNNWPSNALKVTLKNKVPRNQWVHLFVTYDGSSKASGLKVYVNGKPAPFDVNNDTLSATIKTKATLKIGSRTPGNPLTGQVDEVRIYDRKLSDAEVAALAGGNPLQAIAPILALPAEKRTPPQIDTLRQFYLDNHDPEAVKLAREIAVLRAEAKKVEEAAPTTLVFKEAKQPKPAYILKRGEYDQKGEPVGRNTPAFLPPLPEGLPRDRLGLARWLVDPGQPLTARVAVNRFWQQLFGTGLVKTAEDFGSQGEPPSHPELLDWLAVQFMDDGWDVKRFMKRLVMSATYRQSSKATPDRLAKDPANRLLARGPRYRLDAEMLRDQALFVSGLLVERLGGPSVKPPQPAGLWEAVGYTSSNTAKFVPDRGAEKVHRRSLYTFWKRTAPPPQMSAFDAPSRESCLIRRERTNTPLQALLLLNEPQYVECARALAERAMKEGGDTVEQRLTQLFRLAAARQPDAAELAELAAAYRDHLAKYTKDVEAAKKLIAIGESKPDAALDPSELAAWTMVANLVLNLDEVINKG